jgi:hypothetical protein
MVEMEAAKRAWRQRRESRRLARQSEGKRIYYEWLCSKVGPAAAQVVSQRGAKYVVHDKTAELAQDALHIFGAQRAARPHSEVDWTFLGKLHETASSEASACTGVDVFQRVRELEEAIKDKSLVAWGAAIASSGGNKPERAAPRSRTRSRFSSSFGSA